MHPLWRSRRAKQSKIKSARLPSIRPFPTLAPTPESGWRADASAVLRGDLDKRHARVDAAAGWLALLGAASFVCLGGGAR